MELTITQVDAFTNVPFGGNPAAVCVLPEPVSDRWMQNIALEMNLSETAFLLKQADGYRLRWFTPSVEVDLCGHATLASAHVLRSEGHLAGDAVARFHTRSGLLLAKQQGDWIELDFPANPPQEIAAPAGLIQVLGNAPVESVWQNSLGYLVVLDSAEAVRTIQPDFAQMATLPVSGVIVTSRSDTPDFDFISRFFAPQIGINEDPVTGAAHCCLAPFWSDRLHKSDLMAYQASARGGVVKVRCQGDRVYLGGQAVTVLQGKLLALPQ
ncbi:MAG TPA: PhzF family phenazine biosynthesis protein [Coleofasciculaceae cyanobacterium]